MKYGFMLLFLCLFLVGCGNDEATDLSNNENADTEIAFQMRNINQQVENNQVDITAEVSTSENEIYYIIEQGEELIQEETSIEVEADAELYPIGINFKLTEEQVSAEKPPILTVYIKDESEQVVNPNYIPIDVE